MDTASLPRAPQIRDQPLDREPLPLRRPLRVVDGGDDDALRVVEALRVLLLEDTSSRGVGARLEDGPDAPSGIPIPRGLQRRAHGPSGGARSRR